MRFLLCLASLIVAISALPTNQVPLLQHATNNRTVSPELFSELEELARIVDISYCVGLTGTGIAKPFKCLSRCSDFPDFELIKTWSTGQLMSDSCGYIAVSHSATRIIVAFRGTYSIANTISDLSTIPQEYVPYPGHASPGNAGDGPDDEPKCENCTVHSGFYKSWQVTSTSIVPELTAILALHPEYSVSLVGHSLGGAVAAIAGLDFISRGWNPTVTTFGEPRIGNAALMKYIDQRFNLVSSLTSTSDSVEAYETSLRYRRVTHIDDPVPLLPLSEWGYRMHAGEIYITKPSLSPDIADLQHCSGDEDPLCIAAQDASLPGSASSPDAKNAKDAEIRDTLLETVADHGDWKVSRASWAVPSRYKLWQLFFAHRDYFWRLGLCVPGGDPWDWNRQPYGPPEQDE